MTGIKLLTIGVLMISSVLKAEQMRPNIVFVITDDQRWDTLGCTGHPVLKTPNIDRLAEEGALFNNFFACTPLCSPSRGSFLTGVYPHQHKITNNDKLGHDLISHTLVTFPRQLRESGYETAFIGKWHMGADDSRRPGFDHWISFKGQGVYIDGVVNMNGMQTQLDGYMTDFLNEQAVDFVKQPHDKPFCLYLGHKAVHAPFLPSPRDEEKYSDYVFELPEADPADIAGKPVMTRTLPPLDILGLEGIAWEPVEPRRNRGKENDAIVRDQLRCMASVDDGVGDLYKALAETGQLENTIFVYTSDNGYLMGEHGQRTKRWAYEESLRVPLLIRYPKLIQPGSRCDEMVLNIDLAPTLLDLAGTESIVPMHGKSMVPLFADEDAVWREAFLAEYFLEKITPRVPSWQAVRTGQWKYIHYQDEQGLDELYDLKADPQELNNLIGNIECRDALNMLQGRLADLLETTGK